MTENTQRPSESHASNQAHLLATGLGAVGGSAIGGAVGQGVNQNVGAAVGGIVGAIAGGIAGNTIAEIGEALIDQLQPSGLGAGADGKPIELPSHYSWAELQALSAPQGGQL